MGCSRLGPRDPGGSPGRPPTSRWDKLSKTHAPTPRERSVRSPHAEDGAHCAREYGQVEPERHLAHVLTVELHPLVETDIGSTADLPQAGQAWLHLKPDQIARPVLIHFARKGWPRADQAHVALEHVEELRQLIEARPA